jgi:TRAP transporter TAXI family solute receptor
MAMLCASVMLPARSGEIKFINILTGSVNGVYYPLGVALSQLYREALPGVKVSAQVTRASIENLNMLQAERGEVAFALGDTLAQAWRGAQGSAFHAPLTKLRVIAAIYPNYIQIVVRADADIATLADLKGKRIAVGLAESNTALNARAIFHAAGWSEQDMAQIEYAEFTEAAGRLRRRELDAALQSAGLGVAAIRKLAASMPVMIVPIPADIVTKLSDELGDGAYQPGVIPARTYAGQIADVPTAMIRNFLVTHTEMPADVVYAMTRVTLDHLDRLGQAHAVAKKIDRATAAQHGMVPLHAGAEKYYREAGLLR